MISKADSPVLATFTKVPFVTAEPHICCATTSFLTTLKPLLSQPSFDYNMSENKLDKSLDDILSTRRKNVGRRGRGGRRAATAASRVTKAAPVGGVQKATKGAKNGAKTATPNGPAAGTGDTKIIVSNLVSCACCRISSPLLT